MKVIGITGGIGAGKSTLLSMVESYPKTAVIKADEVAKQAMSKGSIVYEKIVFMFGDKILREDGEIDRGKLGDIIFAEPNKRLVLNGLVHPCVKNMILEDIHEKDMQRYNFYFLEAALLLEDHYEKFCDEVWYLNASPSLRKLRLIDSRQYTAQKSDYIMNSQMTDKYIRDNYLTEPVEFGDEVLDKTECLKRYKGSVPWVEIDNNEGQLLTIEFQTALDHMINSYYKKTMG